MSTELTPISYAVMSLVGRNGAAGPELVEMATAAGPLFWTGAASHVLRVARRLAEEGYLTARSEPAKTRPRTVYEMTARGRAAFRAWLAQPSSYPRIQHEAAIRLFASDMGDLDAVLGSLDALRSELPTLERTCEFFEQRAAAIPHRTQAIRLELSLVRRLVQAHRDWLDEVDLAYGRSPRPEPAPPGATKRPRSRRTGS